MSGGNGNYIDKAELQKIVLYKQQLKINFLVGNHNMNQYLSFVACVFSVSLRYVGKTKIFEGCVVLI